MSSIESESKSPPKTALVTGSGRQRVGYVVAKGLAERGYNVAVHYHRSSDEAAQNVQEFRVLGVRCEMYQADVTNEADVRQMVEGVVTDFGSIDLLVTTSSIWRSIPLEQVTAEDVLASFQVNTLGTFLCCRYVGLQMVKQPSGGSIVTLGEALIDHPYRDHAAYFTAKGSIPTLTRSFAVELATRNPQVRVNCVEPGPVMFPEELTEAGRQKSIEATLTREANRPEAVTDAVLFLAANPMITGECLKLDGGRNVGREQWARQG